MQNRAMSRLAAVVSLLVCAFAAHAQTLTLHYQERPPYSTGDAQLGATGLVATPAAAALQAAGIAFRWQLTPSQRQLALVQGGQGLHCGVGWFRNPERAARGRFSAPLYRDRPFVALTRQGAGIGDGPFPVTALLRDEQLRLLVKEGYSYGAHVDRLLEARREAPMRTSVDPRQMAVMLQAGRADWMIVAPEEADALRLPGLKLVSLSDMPEGPTRHLYCSSDVPPDWIERIDRALDPTIRR